MVDEPSVVALDRRTDKMKAVGEEAKMMYEKTHDNIRTIRPLRDGVIADYENTEQMLRYFIEKVAGKALFFKPRIMVCVPSGVTTVEKRAVLEAAIEAHLERRVRRIGGRAFKFPPAVKGAPGLCRCRERP